MRYEISLDREADGRWIADIEDLPGVHVYEADQAEVTLRVTALALRGIADQIESTQEALDEIGFVLA